MRILQGLHSRIDSLEKNLLRQLADAAGGNGSGMGGASVQGRAISAGPGGRMQGASPGRIRAQSAKKVTIAIFANRRDCSPLICCAL